ncbi:uncharacterized protein MELLADRAFT_109983 [Melampsora larici-populina 98AG31]|uniref:Uncharacterized protein n=1 Tax=Melampsora larici-populina (strain 98AG31 / pathotype 3-4-7) TaxID=747676 RepID=F4RY94_MELLP|nr:uncharacterized protein MELLADRAFT_109983 [Melampsora larici-populina 98AG31]EGG02676.1 hypothetical protein MELLADRAFT_109983 [Melampsora larici-populina 98AG31]
MGKYKSPATRLSRLNRSIQKHLERPTYGTVVCLDLDTSELLLVVRFTEKSSLGEDIYQSYNHSISTIYQHAKARGEVKTNGATYRARRLGRKYGRMFAAGFRPGYESGIKGG